MAESALRNEPVTGFLSFKGINNKISPYSLGAEWFAELENVDVLDSGGLQTRPGYTPYFNLEDLYVTRDYNYCFGVNAAKELVELSLDLETQVPFISGVLASDLGDEPYYWCDAGHYTFFMSSTKTLAINVRATTNKVIPWGAPVPDLPTPTLIPGNLPPGQYVYTFTLTHKVTGVESGALTYHTITVAQGQGIQFNVPQFSDYLTNIYVSHGPLPYLLITTAQPTFNYTVPQALAVPVRTLGFTGPPTGQALGYWRSSIYVGVHNLIQGFSRIYKSQSSRYHWFKRGEDSSDFIDLPGEVRLLADCPVGLIIGTDREIWLRNLDNETIPLRNYGVVKGRWDWDKRGRVYFATPRGICSVGEGDSYFLEHTSEKFRADFGAFAVVNILEQGGVERVVTTILPSGIVYNKPTIFDTVITEHDLTGV